MVDDNHKYFRIEGNKYLPVLGRNIHEILRRVFADYYASCKKETMTVTLNGVEITFRSTEK